MWDEALILTILGTAFLYVYISTQLGSDDNDRPFVKIFYGGIKFMLILIAVILPILAIQSNQSFIVSAGVNSTYATSVPETIINNTYRIVLYVPMILVGLVAIFLTLDYVWKVKDQARGDREI